MMNDDILLAINAIISDLEKLSDAELQEKFNASKNGPIGLAFRDADSFLLHQDDSFIDLYKFSRKEVETYIKLSIEVEQYLMDRLSKVEIEAANDTSYLMAA